MQRPQLLLHEHDTQTTNIITNNKSDIVHQLDPEAAVWPQQHNENKPQCSSSSSSSSSSSTPTLDQADLLDYMYQHVQFDEIPFTNDPLYDHRQIYTHENAYMPFGIYEDIQATVAFEMEMENENEITNIESVNTAYMHNTGRTACPDDHTCNQAVRTEVYNDEQNEILKINTENTMRKEIEDLHENDENEKMVNREMSQETPILPVYTPIVDEHHGVMFANSSQVLHRHHYEYIYDEYDNESIQNNYEINTGRDAETFQYSDNMKNNNIPMVEAVYFTTEEAQKVLFDGEMYAVINYEEGGRLKAIYKNELEIPTVIDNGANVNVLPKAYYDQHRELQDLPKTKANMPPIMTGNGMIPAYFWIDIPLEIQGVVIQLRCIVCESTAGHGLSNKPTFFGSASGYPIVRQKSVIDQNECYTYNSNTRAQFGSKQKTNHNGEVRCHRQESS